MTASTENVSKASISVNPLIAEMTARRVADMAIVKELDITDRDMRELACRTGQLAEIFDSKYKRLNLAIRLLSTLTAILMLLTMTMIASR